MNADALEKSAVSGEAMPDGLSTTQQALWMARAGRWDAAHDLCQEIPGKAGCWIHAHLHRQEGDLGNAGYWYDRAGQPMPARTVTIEEEWRELVTGIS